jgi:hypothetical protein
LVVVKAQRLAAQFWRGRESADLSPGERAQNFLLNDGVSFGQLEFSSCNCRAQPVNFSA